MKLYFNNEKKNGVVSAENLMPNSLGLFYFRTVRLKLTWIKQEVLYILYLKKKKATDYDVFLHMITVQLNEGASVSWLIE